MPAVMPGSAQRSSCSLEVFDGHMASSRLLMALVMFCAWDGWDCRLGMRAAAGWMRESAGWGWVALQAEWVRLQHSVGHVLHLLRAWLVKEVTAP